MFNIKKRNGFFKVALFIAFLGAAYWSTRKLEGSYPWLRKLNQAQINFFRHRYLILWSHWEKYPLRSKWVYPSLLFEIGILNLFHLGYQKLRNTESTLGKILAFKARLEKGIQSFKKQKSQSTVISTTTLHAQIRIFGWFQEEPKELDELLLAIQDLQHNPEDRKSWVNILDKSVRLYCTISQWETHLENLALIDPAVWPEEIKELESLKNMMRALHKQILAKIKNFRSLPFAKQEAERHAADTDDVDTNPMPIQMPATP
jgi:hypothetical protein